MAQESIVTARVGSLIAGTLLIMAVAIFSIGHGSRFLRRTDTIEAHFHRINGLQDGAPVTLSGVRIGAVQSIKFPPDPAAEYVVVTMWIERSALDRVRANSIAQIRTMGLLGDKFIEISGGSAQAPPVEAEATIESRDPLDYEALLQKKGTDDLIANVIEMSTTMRQILDSIEHGPGMMSELIRGQQDVPPDQRLTLAELKQSLVAMNAFATDMRKIMAKIDRGEGLAGAMFSGRVNGERLLQNVATAAVSLDSASRKLDAMIDRFNKADGTVARLFEDKRYADELLTNLRESSADLKEILRKINSGTGTIGMAVNDATLYNEAKTLLSSEGSAGWGLSLVNSIFNATHPFREPLQGSSAACNGTPTLSSSTPAAPSPEAGR